jgi:hypothetical protein
MTYQLTTSDCILRTSDGAFIPQDEANIDFIAYKAWVEAGNAPLPAPEPPAPVVLTPAQKLEASGLTVAELKTLLGLEVTP